MTHTLSHLSNSLPPFISGLTPSQSRFSQRTARRRNTASFSIKTMLCLDPPFSRLLPSFSLICSFLLSLFPSIDAIQFQSLFNQKTVPRRNPVLCSIKAVLFLDPRFELWKFKDKHRTLAPCYLYHRHQLLLCLSLMWKYVAALIVMTPRKSECRENIPGIRQTDRQTNKEKERGILQLPALSVHCSLLSFLCRRERE